MHWKLLPSNHLMANTDHHFR